MDIISIAAETVTGLVHRITVLTSMFLFGLVKLLSLAYYMDLVGA